MDIHAEKLELIRKLLQVADEKVLLKIKRLLQKESIPTQYLSSEDEAVVLSALEESAEAIKKGEIRSHAEVEKLFAERKKNSKQ